MPSTYLWDLAPRGVYRADYLDPDGYFMLVAVGRDHRELARVRVYSSGDEVRVARDLRRWIKHPEAPPPACFSTASLADRCRRRRLPDM